MTKRYYCDYCDRSFKDDIDSRKKHVLGSMHMRLKKEHYNSFRDAKTILAEESSKISCKRFLQQGECVFGGNCRFSHFPPQDLENLRCQIDEDEQRKYRQMEAAVGLHIYPSHVTSGDGHLSNKGSDALFISRSKPAWQLPHSFQNYTNLPPSLQPINFQDYHSIDFKEW